MASWVLTCCGGHPAAFCACSNRRMQRVMNETFDEEPIIDQHSKRRAWIVTPERMEELHANERAAVALRALLRRMVAARDEACPCCPISDELWDEARLHNDGSGVPS